MKKRVISLSLATTLVMSALVGCGSKPVEESKATEDAGKSEVVQSQEESEPVEVEDDAAGTLAEDMDLSALTFGPLELKIDTSYDYSGPRYRRFDGLEFTRIINTAGGDLEEGVTADDNWFTWQVELITGMKAKTLWTASGDGFSSKKATAIASGEIPDFMSVNINEYHALVKADLLADLTDELLYGPHPVLQDLIAAGDNKALDVLSIDGRIYGIPQVYGNFDGTPMVWIRKDWMDKLGLEEPKTYADLGNIAKAFMEQDPDGNGEDDTYGLPILTRYSAAGGDGNVGDIFLNVGGAAPGLWQKQEDGTVIYGSIMEEAKETLSMLNDWYQQGIIPSDYATWNGSTLSQVLSEGKAGIHFGPWYNPIGTLASSIAVDEAAEWQPYLLPGEAGGEIRASAGNPVVTIFVVRKDFEAPEAFVYYADLMADYGFKMDAASEAKTPVQMPPNVYNPMNYSTYPSIWVSPLREVYDMVHVTKEITTQEEMDAFVNEFTSGILNASNYVQYTMQLTHVAPMLEAIAAGENPRTVAVGEEDPATTYEWYCCMGLALPTLAHADPEGVSTVFQGSTDSMEAYKTFLDTYENEAYTKMIMGDTDGKSVSEYFDEFVESWLAQGGAEITEEVQDVVG